MPRCRVELRANGFYTFKLASSSCASPDAMIDAEIVWLLLQLLMCFIFNTTNIFFISYLKLYNSDLDPIVSSPAHRCLFYTCAKICDNHRYITRNPNSNTYSQSNCFIIGLQATSTLGHRLRVNITRRRLPYTRIFTRSF